MSRSKERLHREERSHHEAAAVIARERAERERKTARLRELRLAQEKNGPNETEPVKAKTNTKATVAMMKAARARRLKAKSS